MTVTDQDTPSRTETVSHTGAVYLIFMMSSSILTLTIEDSSLHSHSSSLHQSPPVSTNDPYIANVDSGDNPTDLKQ